METQELQKPINVGVGPEAIIMAVGIVVDRIASIPEKDRQDLYTLVNELRNAGTAEDVEAIRHAMVEILEQEPLKLMPADIEIARSDNLDRWIEFVSKAIRDLRKERNWTQDQLAEKTGLPQPHISRLENGQHSPSRVTLEKLAAAFEVSLNRMDPSA